MLKIVCMKWSRSADGKSFGPERVNSLNRMLAAVMPGSYTLHCLTDDSAGIDGSVLTHPIPANVRQLTADRQWAKLFLFSKEWERTIGGRFIYLDLDVVVTGSLFPLLQKAGELILADGHTPYWRVLPKRLLHSVLGRGAKPRYSPLNSSLMVVEPICNRYIWDNFDLNRASQMVSEHGLVGSDQAWTALTAKKIVSAGQKDGVYRYTMLQDGKSAPPEGCRIVFFPGGPNQKPWSTEMRERFPWIANYADI